MKPIVSEDLERYAFEHTRAEPENLQELAEKTRRKMDSPQMLTGRVEGRFLKMLVQLCGARVVLDVGTFTGYSALSMAEGLIEGGRVITCEIDPEAGKVARAAFDESPHGGKIELRMGPALDTIKSLEGAIDMAFIDADKANYINYYEEVLRRIRPGGVIAIDNMLWSGDVLDPADDAARTIDRLNEIVRDDDRVENVLLTVRDGVQLVRKAG